MIETTTAAAAWTHLAWLGHVGAGRVIWCLWRISTWTLMQNMSSSAASLSRMAHHSPPDLGSLLPLGANNMCRAWYCKLPQSYQANISRTNTMPAFNKAVCNQQASRDSAETHLAESRGARKSVNLFWADFPRHSTLRPTKADFPKAPFSSTCSLSGKP